jgi:hypothetical protein
MLTSGEQKVIDWLRKSTVATMDQIRKQLRISHMTVVRALKEFGYFASYNHNAAYYVLRDVPDFDDWGLWAYRDIRFSRYRTLPATIISVVERSPAGLTVRELEERLQTHAANVVSRLASKRQVQHERLVGRHTVYLASDLQVRAKQLEQRKRQLQQEAAREAAELPSGCSAFDVIEVLRTVILSRDKDPDRLARRLQAGGAHITAGQVRRALDRYAVEKKRPL